jgi:hypothetical protein
MSSNRTMVQFQCQFQRVFTVKNITWVGYKEITTPWGWHSYAETCRGRKIWNILIKIQYFLEHLLVFLKRYSDRTLISAYILCSIYDTKTSRIPCSRSELSGLFYWKYFSNISLHYNIGLSLIPQNYFRLIPKSYYIFHLNCVIYLLHSIKFYYIMKRANLTNFMLHPHTFSLSCLNYFGLLSKAVFCWWAKKDVNMWGKIEHTLETIEILFTHLTL